MSAANERLNLFADRWRYAINTVILVLILFVLASSVAWSYVALIRDPGPPAAYGPVRVVNPKVRAGSLLYMDVPIERNRACTAAVGNALVVPGPAVSGARPAAYRLWLDRYPTYTEVGQTVERIAVMIPATLPPGPYEVVHQGGYTCRSAGAYYPIVTAPVPIIVLERLPVPTVEDAP